jgi:hypothetical protein
MHSHAESNFKMQGGGNIRRKHDRLLTGLFLVKPLFSFSNKNRILRFGAETRKTN